MAGITSFGMGKALGAASDAANLGNEVAAVTEASDAVSSTADAIAKAGQDPVKMLAGPPSAADYIPNVGGAGMNQGFNVLTDAGRNITPEQMANVKAQTALGNAQSTLDTARLGVSPTDQIGSVFTKKGAKAGLEAFMKPESILPTAIGAGNLAQMDAMEKQQAIGRDQEAKRQRRRDMDRGVLSGAAQFAQPNNPFAGVFNKPGLRAFG